MTTYHADKYSIENRDKHCRLYWSPSTNAKERKGIKQDLLFQRKGELVFEYRRKSNKLELHDISSVLQPEITVTQFKTSLITFYEKIRHCTSHFDNDTSQLFVYSEQKRIDLTIKIYPDTGKFKVKGNDENLLRFLHAYCDCINSILSEALFNLPCTSQLASANTLAPNNEIQELLDSKSLQNIELGEITLDCSKDKQQHADGEGKENLTEDSFVVPDTPLTTQEPRSNVEPDTTEVIPETQPSQESPKDNSNQPKTIDSTPPDILQKILTKVEQFDQKFEKFEQKFEIIPDLKASIDTLNTSLKILDTRLFDAERNIEKNNERLSSVESNVGRLQTNTVKQKEFNDKISVIETEQKNLKDSLCKLRVQLNSESTAPIEKQIGQLDLKEMADQIRDNILSDLSKAPRQTKPLPTPNYDLSKLPKDLRGKLTEKGEIINNLNHDLLIIGDSNTHPIKEDWIKHNATAAKVLAIKIEDAINAIDQMTIQREPKKILIHVSTNHFSSHKSDEINDRNMEQAKSALEELLGTLDRKFNIIYQTYQSTLR